MRSNSYSLTTATTASGQAPWAAQAISAPRKADFTSASEKRSPLTFPTAGQEEYGEDKAAASTNKAMDSAKPETAVDGSIAEELAGCHRPRWWK